MKTITDSCKTWCGDPTRLKRTEQAVPLLLLLTAFETLQYLSPRFRFKNFNIGSKKIIAITGSLAAFAQATVALGKPVKSNKPIKVNRPPNPLNSNSLVPKKIPVGKKNVPNLKVDKLVEQHVITEFEDDPPSREIALEVAFGNFKGATQTKALSLLQLGFIKVLLPTSSQEEKKHFGLQMYEMDKRLDATLDLMFSSDVWTGLTNGTAELKVFEGRVQLLEDGLQYALNQEELLKNSSVYQYQYKKIDKFSLEGMRVELGRDKALSSQESEKLQELLKNNLNRLGYEPGKSKDNGDCFFDSFRQGLNALNIYKTVGELREIVSAAVNNGPNRLHYQRLYAAKADREGMGLEEYLKSVHICAHETASPTWGALDIEGAIFAEHFQVKVVVHAQYSLKEVKLLQLETGLLTYEKGKDKEGTVIVAGYRNHFVPVLKQEEDHLGSLHSEVGDSDEQEESFGEDSEECTSEDQ